MCHTTFKCRQWLIWLSFKLQNIKSTEMWHHSNLSSWKLVPNNFRSQSIYDNIQFLAMQVPMQLQLTSWSLVQGSLVWNHCYAVTKDCDIITSILRLSYIFKYFSTTMISAAKSRFSVHFHHFVNLYSNFVARSLECANADYNFVFGQSFLHNVQSISKFFTHIVNYNSIRRSQSLNMTAIAISCFCVHFLNNTK